MSFDQTTSHRITFQLTAITFKLICMNPSTVNNRLRSRAANYVYIVSDCLVFCANQTRTVVHFVASSFMQLQTGVTYGHLPVYIRKCGCYSFRRHPKIAIVCTAYDVPTIDKP